MTKKPERWGGGVLGRSLWRLYAVVTLGMGLAVVSSSLTEAQNYVTDPSDGEVFEGTLTITFFEIMQETIAIEFAGTGGVTFDCAWFVPFPGFPRMTLVCTPNGELPESATVTWTINPGGTGFTTESGTVLPTSSGTFLTSGGVTVTSNPGNGDVYDPTSDGPLTFFFSEAMDQTIDLSLAVTFDVGTWVCEWTDDATIECTLQGTPEPGTYSYTLSGFVSEAGTPMSTYAGTVVIEEDDGEVTVFPTPAEGEVYDQAIGPVTFTFSESMDQTVDPQTAITFDRGSWNCDWAFPGVPVVLCTPTGALGEGVYGYTLSGFRTLGGATMGDFTGTFLVEEGSGGNGGTQAPECPATDPPPLTMPKTMWVCGVDFFAWEHATVYPGAGGVGYFVSGSSATGLGRLDSLIQLDSQGRFVSGAMAKSQETEIFGSFDSAVLHATDGSGGANQLTVGAYRLDNQLAPIYQRVLPLSGPGHTVSQLSNGRVAVVQDLDDEMEVVVFSDTGTVSWAKRYASARFGADSSGGFPGFGGSQTVDLRQMPGGLLLVVSQSKTTVDDETVTVATTNILARLTENGVVSWAKRYTGSGAFFAPMVNVTREGTIVLQGFKGDLTGEDPSASGSVLIRLDANGDPVWSKEFAGPSLSVLADLPGNGMLVGGTLLDSEGDEGASMYGVLDSAGNLQQQVELGFGTANYSFGIRQGDRIRYTLHTGTSGSALETVLVGTSSLQLDGWTWRRYSKAVDFAGLIPEEQGTSSVFSAFNEEQHRLDVVRLDGALQVTAACPLFVDAVVEVTPTSFTGLDVNLSVTTETITVTDFVPETFSGNIEFEAFTVGESSICDDGPGGEPLPATLLIARGAAGEVIVEFDTVQGFDYSVERTATLGLDGWSEIETVPGSGARISRTYGSGENAAYYRVRTSSSL
jgi:hypothetical protein